MNGLDPQNEQIKQLYSEMYRVLYVYAKNALNDPLLAEDVTQEVFCIACSKRDELFQSKNPKGWLMITLKNVIQNIKRQQARMKKLAIISLDSKESELLATYDEENVDVLYNDIATRENFHLFKLVELEGHTIKEAADKSGISFEACKKRIQRMRKYLQKKLSPQ